MGRALELGDGVQTLANFKSSDIIGAVACYKVSVAH